LSARSVEKSTIIQAPDTRASASSVGNGWVAGRLDAQRCLRTRLLLPNVPETWDKAKLLRQVHGVRHTRRVTVRKNPGVLVPYSLWVIISRLPISLRSSIGEGCCISATAQHTCATNKPLIS
jgi:hypothetical protein